MLKKIFLISTFLCFSIVLNAQKLINSKEFKISFVVPYDLMKYDTGSESILGYDSSEGTFAVDIEKISMWPSRYFNSQKTAALEIGPLLNLSNSGLEGFVCPNISTSYATLSYDEGESPKVPVYVIAILNKNAGLAYVVTIYCYDNNVELGKKIAKSFRLL